VPVSDSLALVPKAAARFYAMRLDSCIYYDYAALCKLITQSLVFPIRIHYCREQYLFVFGFELLSNSLYFTSEVSRWWLQIFKHDFP
jgi:hypothetical protein